jgi:hypothetical protein
MDILKDSIWDMIERNILTEYFEVIEAEKEYFDIIYREIVADCQS